MFGLYTGVGGKTNFNEDINSSCVREVKEETGLIVDKVRLRGVVKTVLENEPSSWILFVYTADRFCGNLISCDEGELEWVDFNKIYSKNLIGFIKKILPTILEKDAFLEGTIVHDIDGNIIKESISCF